MDSSEKTLGEAAQLESAHASATRLTTAGRLLREVAANERVEVALVAKQLGLRARDLEQCRDGRLALPLETQVMLAAVVLTLAPEHARRARQLHAQAQSAMRVRDGSVEGHMTYYWKRPK